jgi:hypothetical protein
VHTLCAPKADSFKVGDIDGIGRYQLPIQLTETTVRNRTGYHGA